MFRTEVQPAMRNDNGGEWIPISEASERTGYNHAYIQELARQGKIKARKIATVWLVEYRDLIRHIREMRQRGDKPGPKSYPED